MVLVCVLNEEVIELSAVHSVAQMDARMPVIPTTGINHCYAARYAVVGRVNHRAGTMFTVTGKAVGGCCHNGPRAISARLLADQGVVALIGGIAARLLADQGMIA